MHELEMKLAKIDCFKDQICNCLNKEISCEINDANVQQIGMVVDMFKDLCEAEKDCAEACYYKSVTKAMEEYGNEDWEHDGRAGYDNYRYKSSGKFAPKGKGTYYGFNEHPMHDYDPSRMMEEDIRMRMGYDNNGNRSKSGSSNGGTEYDSNGGNRGSRYGYNYDRYDEARRKHDKDTMNHEALYHVQAFKESIKDIWNSSDPELKQKLKSELSSMINNDLIK